MYVWTIRLKGDVEASGLRGNRVRVAVDRVGVKRIHNGGLRLPSGCADPSSTSSASVRPATNAPSLTGQRARDRTADRPSSGS